MIISLLLPLAVISRSADTIKKKGRKMVKKKRRKIRKQDPLKRLKGFY